MNIPEVLLLLTEKDFPKTKIWIIGAIRELALRQVKLEKLLMAAKDILDGQEYHGEDCPGDDYDLPEGESPEGECECGLMKWRNATAEFGR